MDDSRRQSVATRMSITETGVVEPKKRRRGRQPKPKKEFKANFGFWEFVLYLLLLCIFTGVMVNSRNTTYSFTFAESLRNRLDQPFRVRDTEVYKTMSTVSTLEELTQFLRGPFIETLFGEQVDYRNGDRLLDPGDWGWVNVQSRLLGAARIRQQQVDINSCTTLDSRLKRWTPHCYARSGEESAVRVAELYGESLDANGTRRVYTVDTGSSVPFFSFYRHYTDSGLVVDVPPRKRHAEFLMGQLERDKFLSLETRILLIDFSMINVNINMLCVVQLSFERLESGGVFFFQSVRTVRLLPYGGEGGGARRALDSVLVCIVCIYVLQEGWEIFKAARDDELLGYVMKFWNMYDLTNIIIFWASFGLRQYVHQTMQAIEDLRPLQNDVHYDMQYVSDASIAETYLMAINAVLVYFKIFKYIGDLPFISTLLTTLSNAREDLLVFIFVFGTIMLGFCGSFYLGLGAQLYDYRAMHAAFISLFRFLLGDVDLEAIVGANPFLGILLAASFFFLAFLVLLNMFVAIIIDHWDRRDRAEPGQHTDSLLRQINAKWREFENWYEWRQKHHGETEEATLPGDATDGATITEHQEAAQGVQDVEDEDGWRPDWEQEETGNPLSQAEQHVKEAVEERAVINGTVEATNRLKGLYLRLQEGQRERMQAIGRLQGAVRSQTYENAALVRSLAEKGIHVDVKAMSDTLRKGSGGARVAAVAAVTPPPTPFAAETLISGQGVGRSSAKSRKHSIRRA